MQSTINMHKTFITMSVVVSALLNSTISFGMLTRSQEKRQKKSALENAPFNFPGLLPELQLRTAAFTPSHCIDNLKKTCTFLHKNLTFQTPLVWNVVCHSLNCVSKRHMPELLL